MLYKLLYSSERIDLRARIIFIVCGGHKYTHTWPYFQTMSEYTKEQHDEVRRVLRLSEFAYYETLVVEKKATSAEIKRAYKRMALRMHPDKNKAPKSDEAFKRISKAFQVLGDEDKRRIFDQTGKDPDSRSNIGGGFPNGFNPSAFSSARRGPGGAQFGQDDFMRSFFSTGQSPFMATSSFGPGMQFQFTDANDIFAQLFTGGARQRRPEQPLTPEEQKKKDQEKTRSMWIMGIVTLVLILGPTLIEWIFPTDAAAAAYSFSASPQYDEKRVSAKYKIPYYVKSSQAQKLSKSKQRTLDRKAENEYITSTQRMCSREHQQQQQEMRAAQGFFRVDKQRYENAKNARLPHCEILEELGVFFHNSNFLWLKKFSVK